MRIARESIWTGKNAVAFAFAGGLMAGILIVNTGKSILLTDTGLFDEDTLYRMKYMTVDSGALFCYLLRKRLSVFLVLAVAATTYLGLAVCAFAAFKLGLSAGAYVSALVYRYGAKGILLAAAGVFPQYLLYVPAFVLFWGWARELYRSIYFRSACYDAKEKGFALKKAGQLLLILGLAALGCLLEGYVNPALLLSYLKIF
jgi:stage II sporulation protein M